MLGIANHQGRGLGLGFIRGLVDEEPNSMKNCSHPMSFYILGSGLDGAVRYGTFIPVNVWGYGL